jgi:hypothetical protein
MSRPGLQLVVTGHASNAQAFTNCAYVHPSDMEKLAEAAGQPAEVVKDKGLICAVGEAVFTIKCVARTAAARSCSGGTRAAGAWCGTAPLMQLGGGAGALGSRGTSLHSRVPASRAGTVPHARSHRAGRTTTTSPAPSAWA